MGNANLCPATTLHVLCNVPTYNFLGIIIEGNNFLGIIIEGNN